MAKRLTGLTLLLINLLVACSGGIEEQPQPSSTALPTEESSPPSPVLPEPVPRVPGNYPGPPSSDTSTDTNPEAAFETPDPSAPPPGYPGLVDPAAQTPASPPPTTGEVPDVGAYPGPELWVQIAEGVQCESPTYDSIDAATSSLTEAGVVVLAAEEVEWFVCQACGCPSSRHFRVKIAVSGLEQALALGWSQE